MPLAPLSGCAQTQAAQVNVSQDEAEIRALIATMEAAWNGGDFEGYMAGFENPGVVFVSGGRIQDGWQGTLDHYVRDYGGAPERRGQLHFYDISVEMLGPDSAMLVSHYQLERPERAQQGINTRLMRKIDGHWVIALNHVSSYDPHAPAQH
ncbi:L-asparaginase [Candidatus Viadribacter manganicus]|uniref:L-asparaginase n=1 Tax=Candidatus Viadribacter manganicus TaxID=1759059 RepID=A0A1B1ANE3_9PROT|nr:L-asparaginase [Candidatus Viadribacter manganicus]